MSSNFSISVDVNPIALFTDMSNEQFQANLLSGKLVAWDKKEEQFVFTSKSWFGRLWDAVFPTTQNTHVLTIWKQIRDFAQSTQGSHVVRHLNEKQLKAMNDNLTDLALKMGGLAEEIAPKKTLEEMTNGLYTKARLVEESTDFNTSMIEGARKALNLPLNKLETDARYERLVAFLEAK